MTTEIHRSHNPRLPAPSDYPAYVDRVLAERKHRPNRFWIVAVAAAAWIPVLIWPRCGLVLCSMGAGCLIWAVRRAGK